MRETFGLHELAVEDAQTFHMRPKVESYGEYVRLAILRTAHYDDEAEEVEFGEISIFHVRPLGYGERMSGAPRSPGSAAVRLFLTTT